MMEIELGPPRVSLQPPEVSMSRHALLVVGLMVVGCDVRSPPPDQAPPVRTARRELPKADPAPVDPTPTPPPPPNVSLGDGFELRGAVRDGRVALVPIVATGALDRRAYATLHESMARGTATITEATEGFDVEHVFVTNRGAQPLLVLNGEVIIDAHQDRVLAESVVIPARESREVRVRCVESSRAEGGQHFHSSGVIAELPLRQVVAHKEQTSVWRKVDEINGSRGLQPETHTYRHAAAQQTSGPTAERRDRLMAQLAAHPDRARMVGVAVAIDGRVLAVDRFATPDLYRRFEPRLLASYVAGDQGPPREGRRVTPDDIRELLQLANAVSSTEASLGALRPPEERLQDLFDLSE
jgi:ARG/rhodanese/phosphatase superfamily protein